MPKKILIVDDEADLVDTLSDRLIYSGYSVDDAENGREAVGAYMHAILKKEPFDLILLDIRMPGMSGLEALEAIRKIEELQSIDFTNRTPIMMLTAIKQPFMEAFNRGCDDYVLKPVDEKKLLEKIKEKIGEPS